MLYDLLAPFYDKINGELDYVRWADFIEEIVKREYLKEPELWLDLGCGTGRMTLELLRRGHDMTGVDYSPEMLNVARDAAEKTSYDILWLCQDMRELDLYGTVDAAVCCLDSINHLTSVKDLDKTLALVHNYLIPDGVFVFDVNAKHKFETVYSDRCYVMEEEGAMCIWQNLYDEGRKLCDFYITLFKERDDGSYDRYDEEQTERMYTVRELKRHLEGAGFELLGIYSDFNFTKGDDSSERLYIAAKCKKSQ